MKSAERDWWREERIVWTEGCRCIVGVDEAGRGALAGPVVAACVVLPYEYVPQGINDSKLLTATQRETLYARIVAHARGVGIGMVDAAVIDEINILQAAQEAMRRALDNLPRGLFPDIALIDGLPVKPFPLPQIAIVDGDAISASIAAASIIAKVTRDRRMQDFDATYPGYGFASHKGYGAPQHLAALRELGPSPIHRLTFRPVAESVKGSRKEEENSRTNAEQPANQPKTTRRAGRSAGRAAS